MSLIGKQTMTEKNLAAKRTNGRKSRGPVTPQGKAHTAAARLLHGIYSRSRDEALTALGEDPKEYHRLLRSAMEDLQPTDGLGRELVLRMVRVLWRLRRAERTQDGLAMKQVQTDLRRQDLASGPKFLLVNGIFEHVVTMARALSASDYVPSAEGIRAFEAGFGSEPPEAVQTLFPLLRSYREEASKDPSPVSEVSPSEPNGDPISQSRKQVALEKLRRAMDGAVIHYQRVLDLLMAESNGLRSPESLAALAAPKDASAWLMQRIDDSNIRQLWRLTRMFLSLKRQAARTPVEEDLAESDYVDEQSDT